MYDNAVWYANPINWAKSMLDGLEESWARAAKVRTRAVAQGASEGHAMEQFIGVLVYDVTGAMSVYQAITGEDPVTLEKFSASQRLFRGVSGAVQLASIAVGGARMLTTLKGPCGGYVFRRCFVGDTQVVLYEAPLGQTMAYADAGTSAAGGPDNTFVALGTVCVITAVIGAHAFEDRRRRKLEAQKQQALDALFHGTDLLGDDLEETPESPGDGCNPEASRVEFQTGCDRIFSDQGADWSRPRSTTALDTPCEIRENTNMRTAMSRKSTPCVIEKPRPRRRGRFLPMLWLAVFGVLAGACFWHGLGGGSPPASPSASSALSAAAPEVSPKYVTKRIDEIREGDVVMARDEHGNDLGLKRVVEVYRRVSDHLRILEFETRDGTTQTLETTNEHPFWVVNRNAFVNASELTVGDEVAGPHGEHQWLASTRYEPHPEGVPVYNFQVEDYHTYYVQENGRVASPILVHNADYGKKWYHGTDSSQTVTTRGLDADELLARRFADERGFFVTPSKG